MQYEQKFYTNLTSKLRQNWLSSSGCNEWLRNPIGFAYTNLAWLWFQTSHTVHVANSHQEIRLCYLRKTGLCHFEI